MASIITAGTSTGTALNMTGDTSGVLALATNNGTTAMTITTAQSVGIGTASPTQLLHVAKSQNTGTQILVDNQSTGTNAYANYLLNNSNSAGGGGLILFGANFTPSAMYQSGGMYLYTQANNTGGITINSESNTSIYFGTNNIERMRIDAAGNVGVGTSSPSSYGKLCSVGTNTSSALLAVRDEGTATGNLFIVSSNNVGTISRINSYGIGIGGGVPSSGLGITFPATQSDSSNANTLDDYEEGTWTPAIEFNDLSVGVTYSNRVGRYTKVGRVVTAAFYMLLSSKGSSGGGVTVAGLPFASYNGSGIPVYAGTVVCESGGTSWPTGVYCLAWSNAKLYVRYNNGASFANINDGNIGNTTAIYGTITYEATN